MNCNCQSKGCGCSGQQQGITPSSVICRSNRVSYIKAFNEDGCEVALDGKGVLISLDGDVFYTDGSEAGGRITLMPPKASAVPALLSISANGTLVSLGEKAQEGSTIMFVNGFWSVQSLGNTVNKFPTASLGVGRRLAAFTCSNSGTISLGYLETTVNTVLYINEEGLYDPQTPAQLTEKLLQVMCETIPAKLESEEIVSYFGCTEEGKVVKGAAATALYEITPPALVYGQHKNNGVVGPTNGIISIPSGAEQSAGVFTTNYVDVDVSTLPGYSAKAHSVSFLMRAGIVAQANLGGWDLVGVIKGVEYIRVPCAQPDDARKNSIQVQIKIPEGSSKVIRIEGIRQVYSGGPGVNEVANLDVFAQLFHF